MGRPGIPRFRHTKANSSSMTGIGWILFLIVTLSVVAFYLGIIG